MHADMDFEPEYRCPRKLNLAPQKFPPGNISWEIFPAPFGNPPPPSKHSLLYRFKLRNREASCTCRLPVYGDMVQCDLCDIWDHLTCINLSQAPAMKNHLRVMCAALLNEL